jgi:hypothetical protein
MMMCLKICRKYQTVLILLIIGSLSILKKQRYKMKKAIELLKSAKNEFACVIPDCEGCRGSLNTGLDLLDEALAELEAPPRWETPDQWEKRTGKAWPEDWPVWDITDGMIGISTMAEEEERKTWGNHIYVIATEAGPPPKSWRPEEEGGNGSRP